jgi:TonB family protein
MKRSRFWLALSLLILALPIFAQQTATTPGKLTFENGVIANGVYSNECLGFSLPIPRGWETNDIAAPGGKARRRSDNSLVLLYLRQETAPGGIILNAFDSANRDGGAQDFVSSTVRAQVTIPGEHRDVVKETVAVDYGGRHFYRSDFKGNARDGTPLYVAYIYTEFRAHFIGATLASASSDGLNNAADALREISFREDQINPSCIMSSDNATWPLHIEEGVSKGLLVKRVPPDYPAIARQARIQGQVVLRAIIDTKGNIKDLKLVSGHPMLAPAAINAVKEWKYKPYMFQGQPIEVETEIVVNFSLSGG